MLDANDWGDIYTNINLVWHSKFEEGHSGYVKDTKGKKSGCRLAATNSPKRCCQGISVVLVRLTTCERLTHCLPKLSLITLSPPETAG